MFKIIFSKVFYHVKTFKLYNKKSLLFVTIYILFKILIT